MRWTRIAAAEVRRSVVTAMRYPVEVVTGVVILYVLFMALFTGARTIAGDGSISGSSIDAMVIGYCMWVFAVMAINVVSVDLEGEARQGTLEQIFVCVPGLLALMWLRAVNHVVLGAAMVAVLVILLQVSTGRYLTVRPGDWPALLLLVLVTVLGLCGVGLLLGGLTLVFKRIGQLASIVQFGLFFLAFAPTAGSAAPSAVLTHAPLAGGVAAINSLVAGTSSGMAQLPMLALDSAVYALIGSAFFTWMLRIAVRHGMLSHY